MAKRIHSDTPTHDVTHHTTYTTPSPKPSDSTWRRIVGGHIPPDRVVCLFIFPDVDGSLYAWQGYVAIA